MNFTEILHYYRRDNIQEAMLAFAKNREVAGVFRNGAYNKRPGILQYPNDILELVRQGVLEFHCSLEHWSQPMAVKPENYQTLRVGWDMILDIDCEDVGIGKIATQVVIDSLQFYGIEQMFVKFTGGTGFHIGIPFASLPKTVNFKPIASLYPQLARAIGYHLRAHGKDELEKRLLKAFTLNELAEKSDKSLEEIKTKDGIDVFQIADIDTILLSPRHLFRMPYSLHTSGLASVPLDPQKLSSFTLDQAQPPKVKPWDFYPQPEKEEATALVTEALKTQKHVFHERSESQPRMRYTNQIPSDLFPPCVQTTLAGMEDGKKRALFILIHFLQKMNWTTEGIEHTVKEWNSKNTPALPDSYLSSQIAWHCKKDILPPNCPIALNPHTGDKGSTGWYETIGICQPDEHCKKVKNPVNYPLRLLRLTKRKK